MRLLPERPDHDCQGAAGSPSESDRRGDPRGDGGHPVSLHDLLPHSRGHQTGCDVDRGRRGGFGPGGSMTTFTNVPKEVEELLEEGNGTISRRTFLKGSGLLVVSVGAAAIANASPLGPGA